LTWKQTLATLPRRRAPRRPNERFFATVARGIASQTGALLRTSAFGGSGAAGGAAGSSLAIGDSS
jgi:hypothetical protein